MRGFLLDPFRSGYMQRALLEVVLLGVLAGVCSVYVLLRRLAFASDVLTHTIFPGVVLAFVAGQPLFLGAVVFGVLSAVVLSVATRVPGADDDVVLGVMLGSFFSVGVVLVSRTTGYANDLTALLFGRVLAVDRTEIVVTAVVTVAVVGTLALLHKELVLRAFDPVGVEALGYRPVLLDLALNVMVALVVVAAVKAVGTVLVIALLITPAAAARMVCQRLGPMFAVSCAVAVVCGWLGLAVSYDVSINHGVRAASGASIVVVLTAAFVVLAVAGAAARAVAARSSPPA